jgi:hypothetical protein
MVPGRVDEKASRWVGWPEIVRHLSSIIAVMLRDEAWLFYEKHIYQNTKEIGDNETQTLSWNASIAASASFLSIPRTILQGKWCPPSLNIPLR